MNFEVTQEDGRLVLIPEPIDQLDLYNIFEFDEDMQKIVEDSGYADMNHIIIDLGNIPFMDSSAIGRFLAISRKLSEAGKTLYLRNLSIAVKQVFEITAAKEFFKILD